MALSVGPLTGERLRTARRRRRLASRERVGAHSKRQIRNAERELYGRVWPQLIGATLVSGLGLLVMHWALPDPVAPYVTAAVATAVVCHVRQLGLDATGVSSKRIGIMAEQWTADELARLDRRSWDVRHHVMLERSDIDHVAIGPPGVVAIETKFRSSWHSADLEGLARAALRQRAKLAGRAGQDRRDVQCVIAMWGPDVIDHAVKTEGVTLCPGRDLTSHLNLLDAQFDELQRNRVIDTLDAYIETRDVGEQDQYGAVPASLGASATEAAMIVTAVAATAFVIGQAATLEWPAASVLATALGIVGIVAALTVVSL